MEIQLCGGEHTCPTTQEHHPTAAPTGWWKPVSPHNMPSKFLIGTGQRQLIYKAQSENDHSFPGEQEAHRQTSAGLYSDTPLKKQKRDKCYKHTRHLFPLGVFIPQLYHLHCRKFLLPVSKYCCIFAANLYKFALVTLHSFFQNMSLTFVLQLAICFYYLIPTVICLNKTVE